MKPRPYVGITGFKTEDEVRKVADQYTSSVLAKDTRHIPMFGYLASAKRLADKDRGSRQSPAAKDLVALTSCAPSDVLTMIHYHTSDKDQIAAQVAQVFRLGDMYDKGYCRALQLNVDWPDPRQIESIKKDFPDMQVLLQLPKRATENLSLERLADMAKDYQGLASYALIDPSGGKGEALDKSRCTDMLLALDGALPGTVLGVAGGLDGNNAADVVSYIQEQYGKDFSIDAQGRLRTPDRRALCFERTDDYIRAAAQAFR